MVELYIVRHGETDTNYTGKINGSATNLPLNETGRKQVTYLREHMVMDINDFDEIYASPLKRALETAEILNQNTHTIKTDDRLKEINYGSWDGLLASEVIAKHPDGFDENEYLTEDYVKYAENGEPYESVYKRIQSFLDDVSKEGDKKIMVVCHGFITRSFIKLVTKIPDMKDVYEPINAGVTKIKILPSGHPYMTYFNRLENI
ncbi:histidine phosphatase family protein [Companilactobacillus nuruki]|uniref:Phosphoglycerate mutase n=1 Tax=Companilactobacillus nuruki TaxID=1993540 RepID=A0A2N7AR45_9LACO|nr:histidine phosphatase family protein [Companilactobacillus nuruki]PMD67824.1 phosphoglycerate mutase [Companilactobacillus nuruki]